MSNTTRNVILLLIAIFVSLTLMEIFDESYQKTYSERLQREISNSEYQNLVTLVFCEAQDLSLDQQETIVALVLNRVENESFPNDINSVIFQDGQFTSASEGHFIYHGERFSYDKIPYDVAKSLEKPVDEALDGADPSNGSLFYE